MDLLNQTLDSLYIIWEGTEEGSTERERVEKELQYRVKTNKKYSIEDIFYFSRRHAIGIYFIPSTESFSIYGKQIIVEPIISEEDLSKIINNHTNNIKTYGYVKAKSLVTQMLSKEQIDKLEKIGFQTCEVFEIESV